MESIDGEWYMFIIGRDDRYIVHPVKPELIGVDIKSVNMPDGYPVGQEIANATEDGHWIDYDQPNPETGENGTKHGWAIRHDGIIFASGWYEAK